MIKKHTEVKKLDLLQPSSLQDAISPETILNSVLSSIFKVKLLWELSESKSFETVQVLITTCSFVPAFVK